MKADIDKTTAFPIYSLLMPSWDGDSIIPLKVASNTLATTSNPKSPLATRRIIHRKYKIKLTTTISSSSSSGSSSGNTSSSSYSSNSSNSSSITSSLYSLWILRIIKQPLVFIANLQNGAFRLGNHSKIVMGAYFHGSAYLQTWFNTTAIWWFLFRGIRLSRHAPDSLNDQQLSICIQISKYQTPTKLSKCS